VIMHSKRRVGSADVAATFRSPCGTPGAADAPPARHGELKLAATKSTASARRRYVGFALLALTLPSLALAASAEVESKLDTAKYVYVASTRKSGALGKPSEIWFMHHGGAVYVGTPPTSWRVKRIKAGRPKAKIWIGKADGTNMRGASEKDLEALPSFTATGSVVKDPKLEEQLFQTFAKKYADGWSSFEEKFRKGFADGSRVLVKYTPD